MAPRFAYLSLLRNPPRTNFLPQMTHIAADFFLKPQSQRKLKKGEATFLSLHRNPSAQTSLLF